ncbi:MAG TPA: XDD4 family exosortase-dependent surface protein [Bryobacteraceae bacterium]|nr:XDD4 family exosortase-dependent surface protein [Bryobacteraceae bacterium]
MNTLIKALILIAAAFATASANTFIWSTTDATYGLLAGQVAFTTSVDSNTSDCGASTCYLLTIGLSNTSSNPADQSSQILEGLFFDIELTSNSSELDNATGMASAASTGGELAAGGYANTVADICGAGTGGTAQNPSCITVPKNKNGGTGGWEDGYSTTGFTVGGVAYTEHYGIGDAGWGVFKGSDVGNPTVGIAPTAGIAAGANATITGNYPFVYQTATFVLYGLTTDQIKFANVVADYGSALEATAAAYYNNGVPEPRTIAMISGALLLMLLQRRRSRA